MIEQAHSSIAAINSKRLELLQRRINDEDYLRAAIHRMAHVLSRELIEITMEGGQNERQRKRRK